MLFSVYEHVSLCCSIQINDVPGFVVQMQRQPFSDAYGKFLTWSIPATEILLSLMMVTTAFRKLGLYLSTSLMICFTGYIVLVQLHYYGKIPCSCGGVISKLSWPQHLLFNLFFVAIGFLGIYLEQRADSLQQNVHLAK
ncbi:MauE/DoxX family redox-associated membrane protein [Chitinophaga pinensis]